MILSPLQCVRCVFMRRLPQGLEENIHHVHERLYSTGTINVQRKSRRRMKAWQIHQYGGNEELVLSTEARVPEIKKPKEILIEIHAASVNPIDVVMRGGYGRTIINQMRTWLGGGPGSEFPLTLGRDFSGVVTQTGHGVTRFKPGDEVWGALAAQRQGTHSQFCVTSEDEISKKPTSLSHIEAASIPYVATTSWAALVTCGEMSEQKARDKRVLIHGGAGGIGTFAIQLMKAWGAEVVTTVASDAMPLVKHLGADHVIDYRTQDIMEELKGIGKLDLVLDPVGGEETERTLARLRPYHHYVTLVMPLLPDADKHGLIPGLARSALNLNYNLAKGITKGLASYRWAFFMPNGNALKKIAILVDAGKIQPVLDKVFKLEDLPEAYEKVGQKHGRGKTVIDITP
ncbi:reticulon-4-interacting protein 1 homolog, mitochondrial-like [Mya arenaria]|uniref:reticulon-4-interacting protein 1 homolog, mitochondrial-like n=1 Tax=Mya arenaria TaxID=6604 RepID=UPI0022E443C3|nr:reticulon-4-interacting protein 1 homolog, mitochondrial-like [Mya arenaria]